MSSTAVRAHWAVAPASPQDGVMPMRSRKTARANPSRSVSDTAALATSSTEGLPSGATDGITPSCGLAGATAQWARTAVELTQKAADAFAEDPEAI
ncbi:hypothetical protein A5670_02340 [Mycolicibacterium fortuitum]|nr:hypothetical protein A5670_02340 [Mycolicibacterium fortuitum]